ncbi:MAG TPA: hypothetical protein VN605_03480, partial [Thermoanaerobaculia bacterium]|nr:hypothetical protein [Thermoanaerobaculia bacterium]
MTFASPRLRALALHAAILGLFLAAAMAMTWPLALHLDRAVSDPGDPFFTTFTIAWDWHALTHGLRLFDAPLFYPDRHALAFSEHMVGLMLVLAPLFAIGVAPLTIHNVGVLLAFVANAWCMFLLARYATRSTLAAIVAGLAFAFIGFRFQHLPHLHFLWSGWLPLALLFLLKFIAAPTRRNALGFGAALVLNGLSSLHWLVFGAIAIGVTLLFVIATDAEARRPEFLRRLVFAGIGAALLLLPFTIPYFQVTREYGMQRLYEETIENSAEWSDWLVPIPQSRAYGASASITEQECALFPGFAIATLAAIGIAFAVRRRSPAPPNTRPPAFLAIAGIALFLLGAFFAPDWRAIGACIAAFGFGLLVWKHIENRAVASALLWLILGALGARGVRGFLGLALFEHVSAFRGIRVPARWVMIADVGLCLLAAYGAAALLAHLRGRAPRALATALLGAAMLVELRVAPIRWYLVPLDERPVYVWMAKQPIAGGVLELPMTQNAAYEYLWRATAHHRPLLNGVSSYTPPNYARLEAMIAEPELPPALVPALIARRCSLIVVHEGALRERGPAVRAWLRRELDTGNLTFLGRFDAGTRPDWLFAVNA